MENETDNSDYVKRLIKKLSDIEYIKPAEIPNIDLYMDQVTTFMDSHLSTLKRHEQDKILTKTMINNYAKNDLLPPPIKKKYSKEHLLILIFIYYFKNVLSISDIQSLLNPLTKRFFKSKNSPSLEEIYQDIFKLEKSQIASLSKDIINKYKVVDEHYTNDDSEDQEFLKLFSFVCMLSFDVYIKKQMIESIIDDLSKQAKDPGKDKDKDK